MSGAQLELSTAPARIVVGPEGEDDVCGAASANPGAWCERADDREPPPNKYIVIAALHAPGLFGAGRGMQIDRYGRSRVCCPDGRVYLVGAHAGSRHGLSARFATLAEARAAVERFFAAAAS